MGMEVYISFKEKQLWGFLVRVRRWYEPKLNHNFTLLGSLLSWLFQRNCPVQHVQETFRLVFSSIISSITTSDFVDLKWQLHHLMQVCLILKTSPWESGRNLDIKFNHNKVLSGMLKLWMIEVVRVWSFFKVCILAKNTYMLDAQTNKQFTRQILGKVYWK